MRLNLQHSCDNRWILILRIVLFLGLLAMGLALFTAHA